MKVLLLSEVPKIGHKGEIVEVSEGYAKNFLLRKNLAKIASSQIIIENKQKKEKEIRIFEEKKKEISDIAKKISGQKFQFEIKTGENNQIFSSIHDSHIKEKILDFAKSNGLKNIDENDIGLDIKPIKELGNKKIFIKIGRGEIGKNIQIEIEVLPKK